MTRTYTHNGSTHPISFPQLSDEHMANKVRMLYRSDLDHESVCLGARDRIKCLAAEKEQLLKACKDVLAALEKATQETGEILWLHNTLPGVHESAMERLQNVIDDAEGKSETCFDCGEKFSSSTGICDRCHDERDRIDEAKKTIG